MISLNETDGLSPLLDVINTSFVQLARKKKRSCQNLIFAWIVRGIYYECVCNQPCGFGVGSFEVI